VKSSKNRSTAKDAKEREGKTPVCECHEQVRIKQGLSLKFIRAIRGQIFSLLFIGNIHIPITI
jgi:hypothetical protein